MDDTQKVRMVAPTKNGAGMRSTPALSDGMTYRYSSGRQIEVSADHVKELTALGFTKYVAPVQEQPSAAAEQTSTDDGGGGSGGDDFATALEEAGVSSSAADALRGAGYDSVEAVNEASDDDLLAIDGVGPATLEKLRTLRD